MLRLEASVCWHSVARQAAHVSQLTPLAAAQPSLGASMFATCGARRGMRASATASSKRSTPQAPGMISDSRLFAPVAPGAAAAIEAARERVFGSAPVGGNARSGRKEFRAVLGGRAAKDYYEPRLAELGLERVGVEKPVREALFRAEAELNRIGKSRIKGKMRGTSPEFARWMKLADAEEALLEPIDVFAPADALPEADVIQELAEDLTPQELNWLHDALGNVAASAERDGLADDAAEAEGASATDKKATARRMHFRAGLNDKRLKPLGGLGGGSGDSDVRADVEEMAPAAAGAPEGSDAAAGAADGGGDEAAATGGRAVSEEERKALESLGKALAAKAPAGAPSDPRLRRRPAAN